MRRRHLLLLWGALAVLAQVLPGVLPGPGVAAEPDADTPRPIRYELHARLDPATHLVVGSGTYVWKNITSVPVPDFHLHLYLNAFRDEHSTFMRESLGKHRGAKFDHDHPGGIEVTSFRRDDGPELREKGYFASCDDDNPDDRTVLVLPLPQPIAPGEEATFHVAWTSRLPKAFARTGFGGDYHMVAQWFPKPGVFEEQAAVGGPAGAWNCHQFHGSSEFYADYADFDVRLTVPTEYAGRVGASGARVEPDVVSEAGTVTYRFLAHDVHDFAWVCDPDFVVKTRVFEGGPGLDPVAQQEVATLLGRPFDDLNLSKVTVTLLLQPEHADQEERHFRAVFASLRWMGWWFGAYPYETLTVVDPDHRAQDTGGMEYPTLITGGTDYVVPERGWDPEFVLVHEFGHQFFYGLVGTNEFEDAWMDEGLNTYGTARTMTKAYAPRPPVSGYAGLTFYGERPFEFPGLLASLRLALPQLSDALTDDLRLPFGSLGFVKAAGNALGLEPPNDLPLLPEAPDGVTPNGGAIALLREAPFLTLLPIRPITIREHERTRVGRRPIVDPIAHVNAWEYMDGASYGTNSYNRTAASLRTVEALVGEATFLRGMRAYVERTRYTHPKPEQFFAVIDEIATAEGKTGVREMLRTLFERADTLDYAVADIEVRDPSKHEKKGGREGDLPTEPGGHGGHGHGAASPAAAPTPVPVTPRPVPPGAPEGAAPLARKRPIESTVLLRRLGEMRLPVDVLVRFDDGTDRRLRWELDGRVLATDGGPNPLQPVAPCGEQGRWTKIRFEGTSKVAAAEVDPEHRFWVERDRTNDGLRRKPASPDAVLPMSVRVLGWIEQLTTFYGGL